MKRYRIFDTITLEVIREFSTYTEARIYQKVVNTSPCAVHHGNGYVVRFALQDRKYPRSMKGSSGLGEPELNAPCNGAFAL